MRNYSLSDKPGQPYFRITVKREVSTQANTPDGYVSNMLHDITQIGDVIEVAAPCGEFFLDITEKNERPLVLLAAGVGITPIMSIMLSALDSYPKRQIIFIHAVLNKEVQAFRQAVNLMDFQYDNLKVYNFYSDNSNNALITWQYIEELLPTKDADYYFCGPQAFMASVYKDLIKLGVPESQVNFEFFGPRQDLEKAA